MTILDTLPPLETLPYRMYTPTDVYAMQTKRDRIVVEHVVRMCAEVCDSFDPCDPVHIKRSILALLEKP